MRFSPSRQSYGFYGESLEEVPVEEEKEKEDILTKIESFIPAARSFLFGESSRQEAEQVRARIALLEDKLNAGAGIWHNTYVNELNNKRARLAILEEEASEERGAAQQAQITRVAIAGAAVLGSLVVVGMVFNQVQKARLLQVQIRKEEG